MSSTAPDSELSIKIRTARQFLAFFGHHFANNNCLQQATALSYTTLLSLVPLMAVTLSIFTAFPVFESVSNQIQQFVFENFVPTSGEVVQEYIQKFSDNASKLTGPGILFLMVTSLLMMATIDKALNTIWRVERPRQPLARFMVYWSVLTLGPILIGVSLAISSYIFSLPLISETTSYGKQFGLLRTLPFLMETIAFMLLYLVVPNCKVPFRSAFAGGAMAAVLFELAKKGFSFYIANFPTYETIYGAMSTVPVFLVWIFLSWTITLIGAELTWCLVNFRDNLKNQPNTKPLLEIRIACNLLRSLWLAHQSGKTLTSEQLSEESDQPPGIVEMQLEKLFELQLATMDSQGNWLLSHDPENLPLSNLYKSGYFQISKADTDFDSGLWHDLDQLLDDKMDISLAELFASKPN